MNYYIAEHACRDGGRPVTMHEGIDPRFYVGTCGCGQMIIVRGKPLNIKCRKKLKGAAK